VGQNIWVDRVFSQAVLNGTYHFHASLSAFAEFWNTSFWSTQSTTSRKVSRRQVWQAFVQESVRMVASKSGSNLELPDRLRVDEITKQAFNILGEDGVIRSAEGHHCEDCTHKYKTEADVMPEMHDPAGVVGVDENRNVPEYAGEEEEVDINDSGSEESSDREDSPMEVDEPGRETDSTNSAQQEEPEQTQGFVQMVVLDGIVMGPKHCAFEKCTADLANYKNGVFCIEHDTMRRDLCRVQGCQRNKAPDIHTCAQHREC
jgi:hypothetical protein